MGLATVNKQNDRPFLHVRGLVARRSEDPSVDLMLRTFEPKVLTRMEVFALEGSSRELGDLGKLALDRVRHILFDVRLDELEIAEEISVVGERERGQRKEEATVGKYLQARSSVCVGQRNGDIVRRGEFRMCGGFARCWWDRKSEYLGSGNVFGNHVNELAAFRELNSRYLSCIFQKLERYNIPPKNSGSDPSLG